MSAPNSPRNNPLSENGNGTLSSASDEATIAQHLLAAAMLQHHPSAHSHTLASMSGLNLNPGLHVGLTGLSLLAGASGFTSSTPALLPEPAADDEEPIYVNAKQYYRIMQRRVQREKARLMQPPADSRKKYMHESRHRHAKRRVRDKGGRFLKKASSPEAPDMAPSQAQEHIPVQHAMPPRPLVSLAPAPAHS
eukprot:TRINITY_DN339_c0_g1_i1.p1 TRINITY_DN339_c0_g1~~TRINITY_DN339_c0_g1_i1.p1  ORF type:complete len:219 (-),score=46.86 TRINITY_DN339_c0_g1_i1:230-808(-)